MPDEPIGNYWMVHCKKSGPASVRHGTVSAAADEATRLAHENPGRTFYVLRTVLAFRCPYPAIETYETKDYTATLSDLEKGRTSPF